MAELYQNDDDPKEVERSARAVYFYIGQFLTRYQTIEDSLLGLFKIALSGSEDRATRIFNQVNGLESKLELVSAALLEKDDDFRSVWSELRTRIKLCFDNRNQIAHSTAFTAGRGLMIVFDEEKKETAIAGYKQKYTQLKLEKKTKSGAVVWDEKMLMAVRDDAYRLHSHVVAFNQALKGQKVSQHLVSDWGNEVVSLWQGK